MTDQGAHCQVAKRVHDDHGDKPADSLEQAGVIIVRYNRPV